MSFLSRSVPVLRTVARPSTRLFSISATQNNVIKDTAKSVDRAVSDQIVKGIDKGVEVKDKAASTIGVETNKAAGEAKGSAAEVAGQAKGKAAELSGEAKGKAEEVKAKVS